MRRLALGLSAIIASAGIASAQQAAPATPFDQCVKISVVASKPARSAGGYSDYKTQKITLKVKFVNTNIRQAYEGCTATLSALGQSERDRKIKKILMQESVALSLPPGQTQEHLSRDVVTSFDKEGSYRYGYSYDGWIIVIKDAQGKVVQVKSTSAPMEKLTELASKLVAGGYYDAKLKPCSPPVHAGSIGF